LIGLSMYTLEACISTTDLDPSADEYGSPRHSSMQSKAESIMRSTCVDTREGAAVLAIERVRGLLKPTDYSANMLWHDMP